MSSCYQGSLYVHCNINANNAQNWLVLSGNLSLRCLSLSESLEYVLYVRTYSDKFNSIMSEIYFNCWLSSTPM